MYRFISVIIFRYIRVLPLLLAVVAAAMLAATTLEAGVVMSFGSISVSYDVFWASIKGLALFILIDSWVLLNRMRSSFSYFAGVVVLGTFLSLAFGAYAPWGVLPTYEGVDTLLYKLALVVAMLVLSIKINQQVR